MAAILGLTSACLGLCVIHPKYDDVKPIEHSYARRPAAWGSADDRVGKEPWELAERRTSKPSGDGDMGPAAEHVKDSGGEPRKQNTKQEQNTQASTQRYGAHLLRKEAGDLL